jgi:hypothetical protein
VFVTARWRLRSIFPSKTLPCLPCATFTGTVIFKSPTPKRKERDKNQKLLNTDKTMYETKETSDIIGAYCTLLEDSQGICDGQIVGDYGTEVVVRLPNGEEIAAHRDEVIVFD